MKIINKSISLSIIILFILQATFNICITADNREGSKNFIFDNEIESTSQSLCYGFILPNIKCENKYLENQIYCNIQHMVNDILREEINVIWSSENISINVSKINNYEIEEKILFTNGSYIVPFTGIEINDLKIINIVCNYNQSSEIEQKKDVKVPIYLLKEQISIVGYGLKNVKILNFLNFIACGESWYIDVAYKCGFLNYEFVYNEETREKLESKNYNLLIWPGADLYYPSYFSAFEIILDLHTRRNRAIRDFISIGGGFVGSCQAAYIGARGIKPVPAYPSILTKYPKLPSVGILSISDIVTAKGLVITKDLEQEILDKNHPVVYGVDHYLTGGFLLHGPKIVKTGKSVNVIANYKNDSYLNGTASIVSNYFGKGKVVLFSPHSEIRDPDLGPKFWDGGTAGTYNGKRLIANAFYFSTSDENTNHIITESRPIFYLTNIWNITSNLSYLLNEKAVIFKEIKTSINASFDEIENLKNKINLILEKIINIGIEQNISLDVIIRNLYYSGHRYLIYCFDLLKEYLENTSTILETIEQLYPILKDSKIFIEKLEQLKYNLSIKVGNIYSILLKSINKLDLLQEIIDTYKITQTFRKTKEKLVKKLSHDVEIQTEYAFQLMPGGYFDSLKFLRFFWYNLETNLSIS